MKLADVFPVVDEYGNEYTSRDYSTKENQVYVAELAESMRAKGVPDEPIQLVRDGGVYRIKSGNSRVRAMRALGTERCQALVDEDDTVKGVIETVVRTNVKKKYEPVEWSRYVQQLTLFGDDAYVSETAGIDEGKVKRIRRARKAVDDAGDDMTLDRLLLIEEFADDPEAVGTLVRCDESEASWKAAQLRRDRAKREKREAFAAAFEQQGVPVRERGELDGMVYFVTAPSPAEVADYLPPEWEDGQVVAFLSDTYDGVRGEIYVDAALGSSEDAETAELRRLAEAYAESFRAMDADRDAWFWENLANGRPMPSVLDRCTVGFGEDYWVKEAKRRMTKDALDAAKNRGLSLYDYAIGYKDGIAHDGERFALFAASGGEKDGYRMSQVISYLDDVDAFKLDGWDPGEGAALLEQLERATGLLDEGE